MRLVTSFHTRWRYMWDMYLFRFFRSVSVLFLFCSVSVLFPFFLHLRFSFFLLIPSFLSNWRILDKNFLCERMLTFWWKRGWWRKKRKKVKSFSWKRERERELKRIYDDHERERNKKRDLHLLYSSFLFYTWLEFSSPFIFKVASLQILENWPWSTVFAAL